MVNKRGNAQIERYVRHKYEKILWDMCTDLTRWFFFDKYAAVKTVMAFQPGRDSVLVWNMANVTKLPEDKRIFMI